MLLKIYAKHFRQLLHLVSFVHVNTIMFLFLTTYKQLVYKNCTFLGYYAANNCNSLPTFRDYLSLPLLRVESLILDPFWVLGPCRLNPFCYS
jgi:hypothetical protein